MKNINRRTRNKRAAELALRGIALPPDEQQDAATSFSEKEDAEMMKAMEAAQLRKQQEMSSRG